MGERVQRFDVGKLDRFERTGSGGLRVPAFIARAGIQVYVGDDGSEIRELRHPDEVFHPDSLKSFQDAAVTDLHPPDPITPETWKHYAVGTVRDPRRDDERVAVDAVITDADTIRKVEAGERVECSAGYTCVLDFSAPGVWQGQHYDAVQRKIRGNHVALGPKGWGRAGPEVRLRLDSAGNELREDRPMSQKVKVKVDGIEYEAGSESHLQALDKQIATLTAQRDDLATKLDDATKSLAAEKARADAGISAEHLDQAVEARTLVLERARRVLGTDFSPTGKTNREICVAGLKRIHYAFREDASDELLREIFIAATFRADEDVLDEDEESTRKDGVIVKETTPAPERRRYELPDISQKWRHGPHS